MSKQAMRTLLFILLVLVVTVVSSCRKIIDDRIKVAHQPVPVFGSLINPDSIFTFFVSHTQNILDTSTPVVGQFRLTLAHNNKIDTFYLQKDKNTFYVPGVYPEPGVAYRVTLDIAGMPSVHASAQIPPGKFSVDTAYQQYKPASEDQASDIPSNEVVISIHDEGSTNDYYEIVLFTKRPSEEILALYSAAVCTTDDPILKAESDLDYNPPTFYFSDQLFNGTSHRFVFRAPLGASIVDGRPAEADPTYILVRSLSEDYYNYRKSRTRHFFNQTRLDDPDDWLRVAFSGEPTEMFNNIENGFGIFAGYNQKQLKLSFVP